ncbi:Hsk3p KNAG_0A06150 [Huiozyma naganishii CBS 8797]|uniref:DASH complex subunit DAD2 n=1 Tax=Huiozyma naganishii (strain ATCC MYA-139 / BCRC 22969 / CBS 8797 / KCTC 17520 / NBRC 10181 / NCYC 3082 / Yp74L-3) TaxID=1071383 RepID=J7RU01_HUIN7|nr:hypothetical protein KNAG_0A06150 [Kazachstania naganishii CBS 8797]CCK68277.1 hypothetical protein KNAG_0A06150 [Kazachstania naganishii CBS 8797]
MDSQKERQYTYLANQLQSLQSNLQTTRDELEMLSLQCDKNLVGQLGKINASWFLSTNQWLGKQLREKDLQA